MVRLTVLFAIAALSGCKPAEPTSTAQPNEGGYAVQNYSIGNDPAPEGLLEGRLLVEDACLLFENTNGIRYNPVFEPGWEVAITEDTASLAFEGRAVDLGAQHTFGGGVPSSPDKLDETQKRCADRIAYIGELTNE